MPGWKSAEFKFVQAGETLDNLPPDNNPEIIHVDTGFGKFDHHQTDKETCASKLVFEYLTEKEYIRSNDIAGLEKMIEVVTRYDHFKEVYLDNPDDDMFDFSLSNLIDGLKIKKQNDLEVLLYVEQALDGLLIILKNKVNAEKALQEGFEFTSMWGKTLVLESENDDVLKLGFKKGYDMIVRKSKLHGHVRIKLNPKVKNTLKELEKLIREADPEATWFYHASGKMFLNGSSKARNSVPSSLSVQKIINIIKKAAA
jgi:hypothetical protein